MPNNENNWNRNRRSSNQDWDENDNQYGGNRSDDFFRNSGDRHSDRSFGNQENFGSSNYDYNQRSSNYGGNRGGNNYGSNRGGNDYNDDRYGSDNDYSGNRSVFGNATGVNRGSSNYSGRNENDWNRSSRGYSGSDYGNYSGRYSNDRDRNSDRGWWEKAKDEVSSWFGDDDAERRRHMDERQGQHRGKGPKGYTRSDEKIKDDVNDRLTYDPHVDASDIDVSVENCEVTLTGTVSSKWEKRHAEDIVEDISGVKNVENNLKVSSKNNRGTTGLSDTSSGMNYGSTGAGTVGAFDTGKI